MTDFLTWWADHWPALPAIAAYFAWETYKWHTRYLVVAAGTVVANRKGYLQGIVFNRRRREP